MLRFTGLKGLGLKLGVIIMFIGFIGFRADSGNQGLKKSLGATKTLNPKP